MLTISTYRQDYKIPYKDDINIGLGNWMESPSNYSVSGVDTIQYLRFYKIPYNNKWDKIDNINSILVIKDFPNVIEPSFISTEFESDFIKLITDITLLIIEMRDQSRKRNRFKADINQLNTNDLIHNVLSDKAYWRDYIINSILDK